MHLKSLEIFGFKSFADRIRFEFEPGITGVIGPNGCGKSNVVDALRWVMGEQSAKSLRGEEMGDVIFNGTSRRKPAGYCEVVMIFDNKDRRLPIDQDEVSIARRLYRTGDSEYYINKEPCRLRDVRELLMDSGLGTSAYCFIAQGQIERFLNSDPKERRAVFEEAAGISKYRARKTVALRKLERVENNLQTLSSLRSEVEGKLRSLERQAQKAKRYQRLQEELNEKLLICAMSEYRRLKAAKAELDAKLEQLRQQEAVASAEDASAEARIAQLELEDVELDKKLSEANAARMDAQTLATRLEGSLKQAESRAKELEQRIAQAEADIASMKAQLEERASRRVEAERALAELQSQLSEAKVAFERASSELDAAAGRERELTEKLSARQSEVMETVRARAEVQNSRAGAEAELQNLSAKLEKLKQELAKLDESYRDTHARAEQLAGDCVMLADRIGAANKASAEAREELAALDRQAAGLEELIAKQRADIESKRTRISFLRELEDRREGVSSGAKAVMDAVRKDGLKLGVVHGLVADLLKAAPEYEAAIETALGGRASDVVVDTAETAAKAIDFLRLGRAGRASFLPLDRMRLTAVLSPELARREGVVGRACDLVEFDPKFKPVFDYLLGRVLIVRDRNVALALAKEAGPGTRMVTLDGEVVDGNGPISGGLSAANVPGLLTRRTESRQLQAALFEAEQMLVTLSANRRDIDARREAARVRAESANGQARQLEKLLAASNADLASLRRAEKELEQRRLTTAVELDETSHRRDLTASKIEELTGRIRELDEREKVLRGEIEQMTEELSKAKAERQAQEHACAELRATCAGLEEKYGAAQKEFESISQALEERKREIEKRLADASGMKEELERCRVEAEDLRHKLREAGESLDKLAADVFQINQRREAMRADIEAARATGRQLREKLLQVKNALSEAQIEENELVVKLQALEERAKNELGASLEERMSAQPAQAAEGQPEQPQQPADIQAEIEELRQKIRAMGQVNPYALTELQEYEERAKFLATQYEDLTQAQQSLKDAIARINKKSRDVFAQTFEAVREQFRELFRKLFGGGKADIVLEEGVDILDAGVEVIAQPPGRESVKLVALSGGQKAMTTLALLFAIFRTKPSPFCVLDEVDAPLDDANVERFNYILKEYSSITQFIVITHNKATMAFANTLYGVSMPEPGVSRLVGIRFEDVDAQLAIAPQAKAA